MADRSFNIQNELAPLNVELNIPSLLSGWAQLTEAEVKESQTIASVRIHAERAITTIKKNQSFESYSLDITWFCKSNMDCFMHIIEFLTTFNTEKLGKLKN